MRRPNFFIVGAPKCGTTAMYTYLQSHPDIYFPRVKEIYYFGNDLTYAPHFPRPTASQYEAYFSEAGDKRIVGEASVTYLVSKSAAQEIKAYNSDALILIMLRNPIEVMYSMHSQALFTQVENEKDFAKALSLEESRKFGKNIPPKNTIHAFILYRELAHYTDQVKRYFNIFGQERVKVIIHEDFKTNVEASYLSTLHFLNVSDTYRPESFSHININKIRRNDWLIAISNNSSVVNGTRRLIPARSIRQFIARKTRFLIVQEKTRQPLSEELRSQLQREFLPEVERLSELLGRDLMYWCEKSDRHPA